jgi:hypothetical protein
MYRGAAYHFQLIVFLFGDRMQNKSCGYCYYQIPNKVYPIMLPNLMDDMTLK